MVKELAKYTKLRYNARVGNTRRLYFALPAQRPKIGFLYYFYVKERIFMASDCSFDVVSQFDEQELVNTLDQTRRDVQTRFDLKDSKTDIIHTKDTITINTDSEMSLRSVRDILETKAVKRTLSLNIFKYSKKEAAC